MSNSEKIGKPDSLSVWFSLEDIEDFLDNAKAHGGDGIKFYFAAYPKEYAPKPEYAGKTKYRFGRHKIQTNRNRNHRQQRSLYYQAWESPPLLAFNKGIICPPGCNGPILKAVWETWELPLLIREKKGWNSSDFIIVVWKPPSGGFFMHMKFTDI